MPSQDFNVKDAGRSEVLQAQLPQRLARLYQRGARLGPACWDINALQLLAEDAALIATACRAPANTELATCLDALHETVAALLHPPRLPGQAASVRFARLIEALARHAQPAVAAPAADAASVAIAGPTHESGFPLLVTPPDRYWTRFAAASPRRVGEARTDASERPAASPAASAASMAPGTAHARRSREQLLRRVSECLAMEDAGIRAGGLLLFMLENADARQLQLGAARYAALLAEVGEFLVTHVGRNDLVASSGAGHFLLFNPDCDPGLLEAYALNVRDRIARESFLGEARQRVLFDVGACPFVAGATQADAMHEAARGAVIAARSSGRHGVFVVREVETPVDAGLIERIRRALEGGGFQLLFQPIVSLRGEGDEQFQVLLRLQGEDERLHTAAELIPAAKRGGLLGAVDRWVVERCVLLLSRQPQASRPRLFVSQTLESIRDPANPPWLHGLLLLHQVSGAALSMEVHANDATRALADVRHFALAMKEIGASLTISGFEAGVLGERLMRALPVDFIKVAPRYVRLDDAVARGELRALVEHIQESGQRVIAPRVEDARGAASLWAAGIDFIQGNFVQQAGADFAFDFQAAVM